MIIIPNNNKWNNDDDGDDDNPTSYGKLINSGIYFNEYFFKIWIFTCC